MHASKLRIIHSQFNCSRVMLILVAGACAILAALPADSVIWELDDPEATQWSPPARAAEAELMRSLSTAFPEIAASTGWFFPDGRVRTEFRLDPE